MTSFRLRLFLVRHGESTNNAASKADYLDKRVPDPELSERGRAQSKHLAEYLKSPAMRNRLGLHLNDTIDEILVSPHLRTLQTAEPIAASTTLPVRVMVDLYEAGGVFTLHPDGDATPHRGMNRAEIIESFPTFNIPPEIGDGGWYHCPGRESDEACRRRVEVLAASFLDRARSLTSNVNIIAVSHFDTLSALLDALIVPQAKSPDHFGRWKHFNTGISVVDISATGEISVQCLNFVGHLPDQALLSGISL